VLANLDKARRLAPEDAGLQRSLSHATTGAERAAELTDRLLSFARKQPLQAARHDPSAVVQGMGTLLDRTLGAKIAVETQLSSDTWPILADRNQMESAILNLAVNAQQAMPEGGTLRIMTRNVADGDGPAPGEWVLISVEDEGVGMTPEARARAFEPFYTTKPVGEGTGLGLSQVYGFVQQSNGHVEIDSEPGKGTVIRMYLPRAD
jgi:signal transduction histidine kinase